jgi:hypothetical protein
MVLGKIAKKPAEKLGDFSTSRQFHLECPQRLFNLANFWHYAARGAAAGVPRLYSSY